MVLCEAELVTNFSNDGVSDMIFKDCVIPAGGTTAKYLFDAMDRYVFNVFNNSIKGVQAIFITRKNENAMDGMEVRIGLI